MKKLEYYLVNSIFTFLLAICAFAIIVIFASAVVDVLGLGLTVMQSVYAIGMSGLLIGSVVLFLVFMIWMLWRD